MAGVKNTIRMEVDPASSKNNMVYLVRDIIMEKIGVDKAEIFSVNESPRRGSYEVTFVDEGRCLHVYEYLRNLSNEPLLVGVKITPLFGLQEKTVIVHVHNPYTDVEIIKNFLHKYCDYVKGGEKQTNVLGIFNCNYKFVVKLKVDPTCVGGFKHPPASFSIAGYRGYLSYAGQPSYCRNCFSFGHLKENCVQGQMCRNCNTAGHHAGSCPKARKCDLCREEGHVYKDCPGVRSPLFSSVVREGEIVRRLAPLKTIAAPQKPPDVQAAVSDAFRQLEEVIEGVQSPSHSVESVHPSDPVHIEPFPSSGETDLCNREGGGKHNAEDENYDGFQLVHGGKSAKKRRGEKGADSRPETSNFYEVLETDVMEATESGE
ncbi:zinc finger CCHC domain-containing protein 3-like [Hyla sarda]|uniref:zinc finger CCHC domain-containing protein 3-like n=1 Tax=Hyla sarda TaxID=327740 RepID=UPI0024C33C70|nr:zinc finger CCHC domain-containing protein 3-like [Hyla sarda]XP_056408152.1 zinc finger CCHC domain-containing protein 3-like [Hyla sarda]